MVISSAIFAQEKEDILTQQEFIDIVIKYHPIAKQADINMMELNITILLILRSESRHGMELN